MPNRTSLVERVAAVKAFASANYDKDGWDFIVETCDDDDIIAMVKSCWTANGAINTVKAVAKAWNSNRAEISATAF